MCLETFFYQFNFMLSAFPINMIGRNEKENFTSKMIDVNSGFFKLQMEGTTHHDYK